MQPTHKINEPNAGNPFKLSSGASKAKHEDQKSISGFDEQTASRTGVIFLSADNREMVKEGKVGELDELTEFLWSLDEERWKEDELVGSAYTALSGKLRRITVDWMIGLSCSVEGDTDLVFRAVHYLDVFLACGGMPVVPAELPMVALACMALQTTIEAGTHISLADWITLSKTNCKVDKLDVMTRSILASRPLTTKPISTVHQVLNTIGHFLKLSYRQMTISRYVMEGTLLKLISTTVSATELALAVLLITQDLEGVVFLSDAFIEKVSCKRLAVLETKDTIIRFLLKLEAKKHVSNWRKKYSHPLYLSIGLESFGVLARGEGFSNLL